MDQSDWIITLTIIITVVPVIKMARGKEFNFYNWFIVLTGIAILWISICKNHKDRLINDDKERINHISDSTNKAAIAALKNQLTTANQLLQGLHTQIDSIGLGLNKEGKLSILNINTFKKFILSEQTTINVTSNNQRGGQTGGIITNNPK